ncbi:putative gustatory receptor 58c [Drosophila innubila]|uniref:putative gustatory receptor 58c n=1 Tax=Drosophila innubila TaxID=198719 RepID=UPI00148C3EC7|nr:putative gustatory receptor 58c [Drosophila innubila]
MVQTSILITLCRLIGLCNLRYVPERGRFERDNGPMLIYWVSLHLFYVLLMPCIIFVMVRSYFHCRQMDILAEAYSVVCLAKSCLMMLLLSRTWLQRRRWQRLGNGFLAFQQLYRRDLMKFGYSYWLQNLWKTMLSLSNFMLLTHSLFGPGSLLMCGNIHDEVTEMSTSYIFLSLVILSMELIVSFADFWIYYMMDTSNWVLDCLSHEAQDLRQDMRWLPQRRRGCHRVVYQQQLLAGWQRLWRRCMRLDRLILELLHICKWQILLNLFTNYLTDITIIFNLVIYSNGSYVLWSLIGYMILCTLFHWEIMSYFSIFETNQLKWMHLLHCLQKLWGTVSSMDIDWPEDTRCIVLYRQLEFALIFLNRKLQRRPDRTRRLHIAGLFDMNRRSGYCVSTSIAINVLILWQIAYKNYY